MLTKKSSAQLFQEITNPFFKKNVLFGIMSPVETNGLGAESQQTKTLLVSTILPFLW